MHVGIEYQQGIVYGDGSTVFWWVGMDMHPGVVVLYVDAGSGRGSIEDWSMGRPGAEPWDHLCDATEEYLRRAQVELDERLGGVGVDP